MTRRGHIGFSAPALRHGNFRKYFLGHGVSQVGTWMQRVSQEWLVLELTGSGLWLGVVAALQFLPLLLLGPWAGLLADRMDKHRLVVVAQALAGLSAFGLAAAVLRGQATVVTVCVFAAALGLITVVDNPARRSLVSELVPAEDVTNAAVLTNMTSNLARATGPALGGLLIVTIGIGWAFLLNAISYVVVLIGLLTMSRSAMLTVPAVRRARGQVREGLQYVWRTPALRASVLIIAVAGAGPFSYTVTLPLLVSQEFGLGAGTLGLLNSALGFGALAGGLILTSTGMTRAHEPLVWGGLFGVSAVLLALAPTIHFAAVVLVFAGVGSLKLVATSTAYLQTACDPSFRGRVMALWGVGFLGTRPIGAVTLGWLSEWGGVRLALVAAGLSTALAGGWLMLGLRGDAPAEPSGR